MSLMDRLKEKVGGLKVRSFDNECGNWFLIRLSDLVDLSMIFAAAVLPVGAETNLDSMQGGWVAQDRYML
jgi:hypothetical protein